ncbi:MAG: DUF72 domain-containing protein [Pseudomonadota bacterium]
MPRKAKISRTGNIRIGIGGWNYKPWRGVFYPKGLVQKSELEYASRKLTSIEINSTFYGSQKPASFTKWYAATPDDFTFSVKGPMFATHRRVLAEAGDSIERFFASGVLLLQEKLGPINWQLGPEKKFDAGDLADFLALLPRKIAGRAIRHAIEVRHPSFDTPEFPALARRHGVAIVVAGDSRFPQITQDTAPFVYVRIMGTTAKLKNGYSSRDLDAWAARASKWAGDGREVFLYVISGCKKRNPAAALALIERVALGAGPLPR